MRKVFLAAGALVAMAGAAIYFADRPPERLRTVTGPLSERECTAWREQAERFERRQPGWFAVYEGFAHLQGVCLPKDPDRGHALIEGALAARLDEMLVIPFVEALAMTGDRARAAPWTFLAVTANQLHFNRTNRPYSQRDFQLLLSSDRRMHVGTAPAEWDVWYPRVRAVLDRPPILPNVESAFLQRTIRDLARIRMAEAYLLLDEVQRSGRILDIPPAQRDTAISLAARCGNTEALRRKARYFLADELNWSFAPWIVGEIAWLHARTGAETELLAAVLEKAGFRLDDPRIARERESKDRLFRDHCAGGETPIDGSTPR